MTNEMNAFTPTFCPFCGQELLDRFIEERERKYCERCGRVIYQNPKPTAGVVVVDDSKVLLVKRGILPDVGEWGVPAGYIEIDESPREAAVRELQEETSVIANPEDLILIDTVSSSHPTGKSVISIGYAVPWNLTQGTPTPGNDAEFAKFWNLDELEHTQGESLREHDFERVRNAIQIVIKQDKGP